MSIFYYINDTDRSGDVQANTFRKKDQIQQRTDSCRFKVFQNTKPNENEDLKIYDGGIVLSHAGDTIVLKDSYQIDVNAFRPGQAIWLKLGDSSIEKATVDTYTESTRTIVLTASPALSLNDGDQIGELIFGGTIVRVKDQNIGILENIEYTIIGVDYTKFFDKKIVNDSWEDVDSRYIVNDFLNSTINFNSTLDNISYANDGAIQAEWLEAVDGANPTVDASDFLESTSSGVFSWTFAGGTASWTGSPTSKDLSDLFGVASGQPTKGFLMGWFKTSDQADITSIKVRIGSAAGDYAEFTFTEPVGTDWEYGISKGVDATITGTPDWTATDFALLLITETGDGQIMWNGLRVNDDTAFTLFNVKSSPNFDDLRSPQFKPIKLIDQIARTFNNIWYIDYERDIHLIPIEEEPAPFDITDSSDNFTKLKIEIDTSNLGNRIIIEGGEITSTSTYAQVFEGDGAVREWVLKTKFKNLSISIDDNSSTDTMEGGTTTTTVKATLHGLSVGDHITNRSRSNVVRQVLTVPDDGTFTVEAVTAQASGDTFSKFDTSKTSGIEGIVDETTVDYVQNSNEKSARATASEATLDVADFIRFEYNERVQISIQIPNSASINSLKAAGLGDGVFDLDTIVDRNIEDTGTALSIANAKLAEYSNPVINGSFITDQKGLRSGQLIRVTDSTGRSIDDTFLIQTVASAQNQGGFRDYFIYDVKIGTTLFGWIEFMQKLLRAKEGIEINTDAVIEHFASSAEQVDVSDVNQVATGGGFLTAQGPETVEVADVNTVSKLGVNWRWEPNGVGQPLNTRWNLFHWGS